MPDPTPEELAAAEAAKKQAPVISEESMDRFADRFAAALDRRSPVVTTTQQAPAQPARIPDNPLDLLTKEAREQLDALALVNPAEYGRQLGQLTSQHSALRMQQQAAPLIESNARLGGQFLLSEYRTRRVGAEPDRGQKIAAEFDKLMAGENVSLLPNLTKERLELELNLRWDSARAKVLETELKTARDTPTLLASGSAVGGGGGPKDMPLIERLPAHIAAMAKRNKFTEDQIKELAELSGVE